jgi:hypothetical protein
MVSRESSMQEFITFESFFWKKSDFLRLQSLIIKNGQEHDLTGVFTWSVKTVRIFGYP